MCCNPLDWTCSSLDICLTRWSFQLPRLLSSLHVFLPSRTADRADIMMVSSFPIGRIMSSVFPWIIPVDSCPLVASERCWLSIWACFCAASRFCLRRLLLWFFFPLVFYPSTECGLFMVLIKGWSLLWGRLGALSPKPQQMCRFCSSLPIGSCSALRAARTFQRHNAWVKAHPSN